jgi:Neuraminidase (sialidase)
MKYFILLAAVALFGAVTYTADTNLSNTTGLSCTSANGHSIATDSRGRVHLLWTEMSLFRQNRIRYARQPLNNNTPLFQTSAVAADTAYYYRRSLDDGATWQSAVRLISAAQAGTDPAIATDRQDAVHVVWEDARDGGNTEIYYKRSTDGGATWDADTRLTTTDPNSEFPAIAAANGITDLSWTEDMDTLFELQYQRSTDTGATWSAAQKLTDAKTIPIQGNNLLPFPVLAATGNTVHLAWHSATDDTTGEIYYLRSTDGGTTWSTIQRITHDPEGSIFPSIAASSNQVGLVWNESNYDTLNPKSLICFKHSLDGGATWTVKKIISDTTRLAFFLFDPPQIAVSNQQIAVVWGAVDAISDSMAQICLVTSADGGTTWSTEIDLAPDNVHASYPSIAFDDSSNLHIAWSDDRSGMLSNFEVYYTKQKVAGVAEKPPEIQIQVFDLASDPNPFRGFTKISYTIPNHSLVNVRIFDASGRLIRMLAQGYEPAGFHTIAWDGRDELGRRSETGVYLVQLLTGTRAATAKIILMK